ncbi:MAG TPA: AMP-binding protein [Gaiellaceae bacterium]|nr:AMP-binding protein [Gaiellaceae bacterium]
MSAVSAADRPWLRFYGDVPETIEYPEVTLYEALMGSVRRNHDATAYDFLGATATYRELGEAVDRCAAALASLGLGRGDRITISMPTSPQGVIPVYAAARLGAVASMIHPLSTPAEVAGFLNRSSSRIAVTLDAFYRSFADIEEPTPLEHLVLARIADDLSLPKRVGFWVTRGRKIPRVPPDPRVRWWSELMAAEHPTAPQPSVGPHEPAAILYSGGTTGAPKGIVLSHRSFVTEALQVRAWVGLGPDDTILAALPIFHGFGLAALVNAGLLSGCRLLLVPIFSPESTAELLRKKRPTLIAGVPTLYEALTRNPALRKADLSSLRAAFSGADSLPEPVRLGFEELVAERGGRVRLLEGYGLTEAVTGIMGMPLGESRPGSIGIPFPDILVSVCRAGETEEVPVGEEGEICVSGPPVMLGYLDDPKATAAALRLHPDGRIWLHTGDIGRMDEDGFFYFTSRLKRMIKSSGFNVFPAQVETALYDHPAVAEACVIGVPDASQGERVVAVVVPREPDAAGDELAGELIGHCRLRLIKWSCPREVDFAAELPRTKVGKIDFTTIQREATERRGAAV